MFHHLWEGNGRQGIFSCSWCSLSVESILSIPNLKNRNLELAFLVQGLSERVTSATMQGGQHMRWPFYQPGSRSGVHKWRRLHFLCFLESSLLLGEDLQKGFNLLIAFWLLGHGIDKVTKTSSFLRLALQLLQLIAQGEWFSQRVLVCEVGQEFGL